jgi:hypothetical protein
VEAGHPPLRRHGQAAEDASVFHGLPSTSDLITSQHTERRISMHGSWRKRLVTLILTAAVASAAPAGLAVSAAAHGSLADCPFGTNWDAQTGTCQ